MSTEAIKPRQEMAQHIRQLLLLQETVKKVNSILDLEQLLDEIVGSVAETFGCSRTAVLLKDDATDELEMIALRGFADVHLKGYRFKIGGEGIVGHVGATHEMRYAPNVRVDPFYVPSEPSTLSEVDIPLISRGQFIGIFNAQSSSLNAFPPEQIELLRALADNIAIAIENARLFKQERLEKEKGLREQEEARRIQRALLPDEAPAVPGYAIDGVCLQLSAVGGDWYDYLQLADGMWGIALGDVSGKGIAAALLMAATRSLFRRAAAGADSPSEVLTKLNDALLKDLPEGRFVTMAYLVLDARNGSLTVANAGHPYPLLVHAAAQITPLETTHGQPLGLMSGEYSETKVTLERGDRVLIYSDGVAEATDRKGEEYGEARLAQLLPRPGLSAKELLADVQEFTRGGTLSDDATAIVIRRD
jgi:sigma-B regulation protein RsbU (phosphoserine phosphatase)